MVQKYLVQDSMTGALAVVYIEDKKQVKMDITNSPVSLERMINWNFTNDVLKTNSVLNAYL